MRSRAGDVRVFEERMTFNFALIEGNMNDLSSIVLHKRKHSIDIRGSCRY